MAKQYLTPTRLAQKPKILGKGGTGACFSFAKVFLKPDAGGAEYSSANEWICAKIAEYLRLPVPSNCIVSYGGKPCFASMDGRFSKKYFPPCDFRIFTKRESFWATGLLLFDTLVLNPDRHSMNFAYKRGNNSKMLMFDHGHALLGAIKGNAIKRLQGMKDRMGVFFSPTAKREKLHPVLEFLDHEGWLETWASRISEIPDYFIQEICQESRQFGVENQEIRQVIETLKYRRTNIRRIVFNHRDLFLKRERGTLFNPLSGSWENWGEETVKKGYTLLGFRKIYK